MKKLTKITLGLLFMCLLVGSVYAVEVDDFKAPSVFGDFKGGQSINEIDSSIQFYIYKFDAADYTSDEDYDVTPLENNTYKIYDKVLHTTGVQEKINVDGKDFTVYLSGHDDVDVLLGYLSQFNELNNIEPIAI